jgi:hypothetical protein
MSVNLEGQYERHNSNKGVQVELLQQVGVLYIYPS